MEKENIESSNNSFIGLSYKYLSNKKAPSLLTGLLILYLNLDYPPKSSNDTFSGGTPKSSTILITAAFINGGPQK
mgnify:CR=1 FL=1